MSKRADKEQLLELISVLLEEKGFDVEYVDGELYVDTGFGLKVTVDVVA